MRQTVEIVNETGLHARPASEFTKLAASMKCDVFLEKESKRNNAKSILGILLLAIGKGDTIDIITEGEDEQEALNTLVKFVSELRE